MTPAAATADLLLAVDRSTPTLSTDDRVLAAALRERGVPHRPFQWGRPAPPGHRVLLRSTWDYVEQPRRFAAWLDELDGAGVDVANPTALVRWNMHKRYLLDLSARGVPTVPTAMLECGSGVRLDDVLAERGWDDAVVKPAIGATSRRTIHVGRVGRDAARTHFDALLHDEDALVQPFVPAVVTDGELSVVAIAGELTHAVLKRPAAGEWRVQSDFGGTAAVVPVTTEHRRIVAEALGSLDVVPTYARIDLLRHDRRWVLAELELIEPELFFRLAPAAATRLADVIARDAR